MSTVEYSVFWPSDYDQENGWPAGTSSDTCGTAGAVRYLATGTADEVKALQESATGYTAPVNAVGSAFFGYESTGTASSYGYLTLDGYDPIGSTTGNTTPIALPYLTLGGLDSTDQNTENGGDVGGAIEGPFTANPTVPSPTQITTH